MAQKMKCDVLSIDAWADGDGGWTWNQWYSAHPEPVYLDNDISDSDLLAYGAEIGLYSVDAVDQLVVEDDQYNMVVKVKDDDMPLFAFAYGAYLEENQL